MKKSGLCRAIIAANCWTIGLMAAAATGVWYYGLPLVIIGVLVAPEKVT